MVKKFLVGGSMIAMSAVAAISAANAQAAPAPIPAPAPAEGAEPSDGAAVQEIIVTAQRRSENLQKSSLAISVVGADQIRAIGPVSPIELGKLVSGVQVSTGGVTPQIYIRGVGDFGATANANAAVAFSIDGVYVARQISIGSNFFDVARLEILKGPQGTLYGRNATGGAINLITNQPKLGIQSGAFNLEVGNYNLVTSDGAYNIPLGDTFAARFAYQITHRDGYVSGGLDDDKHESVRLQTLWQPDDRFSLKLAADYSHLGGNGGASVLFPRTPGLSPWTGIAGPGYNAIIDAFNASIGFPGFLTRLLPEDNFQNSRFWNVHAEAVYDFGFAALTVIPAYRDGRMTYLTQNTLRYDVGGAVGGLPAKPETSHQTSVEARLSHDGSALKWVVGGYFFNEDQYQQFTINSGLVQHALYIASYKTRSYAGFGEATYSLTDKLRLIAGGRYTTDRKSLLNGRQLSVFPAFPSCLNPAVPLCPTETFGGSKTFKKFSWKGGAEYDLSPTSMIFVTAANSFKSGGFNPNVEILPGSTKAESYNPETLTAYTFGSRNRFFGNRLQANLELFYWDYRDHQEANLVVDGQGNLAFRLANAGKARQYGASLDLQLRPTSADTLHASVEYLNSKYTSFTYSTLTAFFNPSSTGCRTSSGIPGQTIVDCSGFALTRAPKWSGNAGYTHEFALSNGGSMSANGDLSFGSARWIAADFIPNERASGYVVFNASLGYTTPDKAISITGFIKNIAKKAVYTGGLEAPFLPGVVGAQIAAPRTYGLRLTTKF